MKFKLFVFVAVLFAFAIPAFAQQPRPGGFKVADDQNQIVRVRAIDGRNEQISWAVPVRIGGQIFYLSTLHGVVKITPNGVVKIKDIRLENISGSELLEPVSAKIVFSGSNDPFKEDLALLKPDRALSTDVANAEEILSDEGINELAAAANQDKGKHSLRYAADQTRDVGSGLKLLKIEGDQIIRVWVSPKEVPKSLSGSPLLFDGVMMGLVSGNSFETKALIVSSGTIKRFIASYEQANIAARR